MLLSSWTSSRAIERKSRPALFPFPQKASTQATKKILRKDADWENRKRMSPLFSNAWQVNSAPSYYVFVMLFCTTFLLFLQTQHVTSSTQARGWHSNWSEIENVEQASKNVNRCAGSWGRVRNMTKTTGSGLNPTSKQRKMYSGSSSSDDEADKGNTW